MIVRVFEVVDNRRSRSGTRSELLVAADLIARGYEVFYPFTPSTCDLVAHKAGELLRVEVKTGGACLRQGQWNKHDVLARVDLDRHVVRYHGHEMSDSRIEEPD